MKECFKLLVKLPNDEKRWYEIQNTKKPYERYGTAGEYSNGDKAYGFKDLFERNKVNFYHGVAMYLLTYCKPYSEEVLNTKGGWIPFETWFYKNKDKLLPLLNPVEKRR